MKQQKQQPTTINANIEAKSVDQLEIARKTKEILGGEFTIDQIQRIIVAEQQACGEYLSRGAKIVKWNYMTLYPSVKPARKLKCPKNGVTYDVKPSIRIVCRIGEGLRRAAQNQATADASDTSTDAQKLAPLPRKTGGRERLYAARYVGGGIQSGQSVADTETGGTPPKGGKAPQNLGGKKKIGVGV